MRLAEDTMIEAARRSIEGLGPMSPREAIKAIINDQQWMDDWYAQYEQGAG
jgi:hypothetical protein